MLLEVFERFSLLELLEKDEDHYATLKTLRRAREMITFTPDEVKTLGLRQNAQGALEWDTRKATGMARDLPVDEWTTNYIRSVLVNLEQLGKLKERYVSLYEKFITDYRT